jgi:hypothetical protein
MVTMILSTTKEPASAGSRPFVRDDAPSIRSAQIVLDDEQWQLIEPDGMNGKI